MTNGNTYIAVGFCGDSKGEESNYPQVGGVSSSMKFQAVYWRCVVVHFASSVRNNPNANHILFTNLKQVPNIGNFKTEKFLADLGVKIVSLPFTYQPPASYFECWRSTFYKFDMLKYLGNVCKAGDSCVILDSDCIWINSVDIILSSIEQHGFLTYEIDYHTANPTAIETISGLAKSEVQRIYEELEGRRLNEVPKHFGAEIIAGSGQDMKKVSMEVDSIWEISLKRAANNQIKFNTEEYMLSYAYSKLGYAAGTANPYIKRIWTERAAYNNASNEDFSLSIWHLPAEKIHGIRRLFRQACNTKSSFWHLPLGKQFAQYVGSYIGIPKPTRLKITLDSLNGTIERVQRKVSKIQQQFFINLRFLN